MSDQPDILLLDDGELTPVARQLESLGISFKRVSGAEVDAELSPPRALLLTTPARAALVRRGSPPDSASGRPIRIVAVGADPGASRRTLRRIGFHLIVRLPVHDEVWRLLADRALYQGEERREDDRVPVGSATSVHAGADMPTVMLMDISNRGCRVVSDEPFEDGEIITVEIPDRATGQSPLTLKGQVARTARSAGESGAQGHASAVLFDAHMTDSDRVALGALINRWSTGPASLPDPRQGPTLPACESAAIPGLMLDDMTDPAVIAPGPLGLTTITASNDPADEDRRSTTRAPYATPVMAHSGDTRRVFIGRDLSTRGIRIEPVDGVAVGSTFRLALHGASSGEAFVVDATVARDDGDSGIALQFGRLAPEAFEAIEKLMDGLPMLDALEQGEAFGLGAVVGEILDD